MSEGHGMGEARGTGGGLDTGDHGVARVVVVPTAGDVATYAAHEVALAIETAVRDRGTAHLALTGGSTAAGVYRALAADGRLHVVPWHRVHLWWGDDRFVPRDHRDSNAGVAESELIEGHRQQGVDIPRANVHPVPTDETLREGGDETACAAAYSRELRDHVPAGPDGWPVFDLVLLGVGGDGHLLSVFPESAAFASTEWAVGVPAPTHIAPHLPRVTLNPAVVPAARAVLAMATGEGKAGILATLFTEPRDVHRRPAQLARRAGATWVVDEDAGRALPAGVAVRKDER